MNDTSTTDPDIVSLLGAAAEAQRRGDASGAARSLEQALARDPNNPSALNSLGMMALARSDHAAAADLFERAANADPEAPPLWVNLATARRARGDAEGERAALQRVLDLDQRHLIANIRMAELHERLGENTRAGYRWSGVLTMAQAMPERPPALTNVLGHAQAFVAARGQEFADALGRGLEKARAEVDGRERRRFETCLDAMLGRRLIYHNICAGLHFPFLPADEFFERSHFPWMAQIEAQTDVIRAELEALLAGGMEGFSPYVTMEPGTPPNKWSELDHKLDWGAFFLWYHGEPRDEACARCPRTAAALAALPLADMPKRAPTAFFSVLKPKTRLPAHTGVSNVRTIVHLPLIVPPGCGLRVGGEVREWRIGEALAFDDTIEHEAWNESDQLRAVLIFDVWNPHLTEAERTLLRTFFATADQSGFDPGGGAAVSD